MPKFIDLTSRKFGRLTVIESDTSRKGVYWICKCECGNTKSIKSNSLLSGVSKSCGCLQSNLRTNNLIGQKFGKLTVVERTSTPNRPTEHHAYWLCLCECGNNHIARGSDLKNGNVQSCGCLQIEKITTHGMRHTPIYAEWCSIKQRCYNPNNKSYKNYGYRGILMCERWRDSFEAFYEDVSKLSNFGKEGYSLNRINNDGIYEPNNVEWANDKTQANNKRNNHLLEYNGKIQTIAQWADELGINQYTLYNRILTYHWSVEKALTTPVKVKTKHPN